MGRVNANSFDGISEFTALELKQKNGKLPKIWGVVLDIVKEEGLFTIAIKNTSSGEPIKIGPLLQRKDVLECQKLGRVLPPILTNTMKKVLITVDGFWMCLVPNLVNTLINANCEVVVCGPLSLKALKYLSLAPANQVFPIDTFTSLSQEILKSDADTLICLNTPLWQRKITNFMWCNRVNKYLITVNNLWM